MKSNLLKSLKLTLAFCVFFLAVSKYSSTLRQFP